MGREAMAALLSSVALIVRRRRDVRDMQPAWCRLAAALLVISDQLMLDFRDCGRKWA